MNIKILDLNNKLRRKKPLPLHYTCKLPEVQQRHNLGSFCYEQVINELNVNQQKLVIFQVYKLVAIDLVTMIKLMN